MEIRDLSALIIKNSEKYAEILSVLSTLLKYSDEAEEARVELYKRIPKNGVVGFNNFGYFPKSTELHLLKDFMSPEGIDELEELGLLYKRYVYDSGHAERKHCGVLADHNIVMPYKNTYGDIIGLVGRTLLTKEEQKSRKISKYKNTSILKSMNLFGMYEAKKHIIEKDAVFIVEGQFDCITCHRFGYKNVVALGSASFTKFHFLLLKRYTNNIYLLLDNDDAGRKQTNKIISRHGDMANIIPISIPSRYKDIDECLVKGRDFSPLQV